MRTALRVSALAGSVFSYGYESGAALRILELCIRSDIISKSSKISYHTYIALMSLCLCRDIIRMSSGIWQSTQEAVIRSLAHGPKHWFRVMAWARVLEVDTRSYRLGPGS